MPLVTSLPSSATGWSFKPATVSKISVLIIFLKLTASHSQIHIDILDYTTSPNPVAHAYLPKFALSSKVLLSHPPRCRHRWRVKMEDMPDLLCAVFPLLPSSVLRYKLTSPSFCSCDDREKVDRPTGSCEMGAPIAIH